MIVYTSPMHPNRRTVLAALLLPLAPCRGVAAGTAEPPYTRTIQARLRPGGPALQVRARAEDLVSRLVRITAAGPGAPAGEVVLSSHYGGIPPLRLVRLRGRDVVVAELTGLSGTGVAQQLGVLIAADDGDRLRVIGIENLTARDSTTCGSEATLTGRLAAGPGDGLTLDCAYKRVRGPCGPRRGRAPHLERWTDQLTWDGQGAVIGAPAPAGSGPVRRATATARAKTAALLAQPVTDLSEFDWDGTGLYELVQTPVT